MQQFERNAVFYLLKHLVSGMTGGVVFTTTLLVLDVASLASLMAASDQGMVAGGMLLIAMALTFGGAAVCVGVLALAHDQSSDD